MLSSIRVMPVVLLALACAQAQPIKVVVKLLAPIGTRTSNVGDRFTALVEEPATLFNGIVEGRVTKLVQPQRGLGKGKPEINFEFETLTHMGNRMAISAQLKELTNSKGVRGVDEEGRVIGVTSNKKRLAWAAALAGAGAAIGGATNGIRGAATGAGIGAALGLALAVKMTSAGSDIELQTGSHFTLDLFERQARR